MVLRFSFELLVASLVNYVLIVLHGASFTTYRENYVLAIVITLCTAVPVSLFIQNWDQLINVIFDKQFIRKTDFFVYYITYGTYLGAYLGAIPIPLDWDRPWQVKQYNSRVIALATSLRSLRFFPFRTLYFLDSGGQLHALLGL
ncbi:Glycosylphosphatidylinositol anchor biosynthesis protein 11 [Trichinella pseudospiralis]|uniref:Glycosylphosphatidylinositol anchor biosynthesis protein 11 n=1 Tax=Trichinella pseudospiralis TaxID=6337 RepID=A0A0V1ID44_TRIPS|nr:Glycosylphosphatidylinositol anchor biosynthesis protein 11 [Trichinella pseudospiralis]